MSARQAALVAFLAGCLLGVLAGARYQRTAFRRYWRRGPDAGRALSRLTRDLDLDAAQQRAVQELLEKQRQKIVALHEQASARLQALRLSSREELRPLLKPEQLEKFQALSERWDRKHPRD